MAEIDPTDYFDSPIDGIGIDDPNRAVFQRKPIPLADGDAVTVDARGMAKVSVYAGSGATVTWSRVDTHDASSHGSGGLVVTPPSADTVGSVDVDWQFYRISTSGGVAKVAVV